MSSSDLEIIDGAVPLVRNDEPWEWLVVFWDDEGETTPTDLTGKTVAAEIRWTGGVQSVLAEIADPPTSGQVVLSLAAADTADMPLGRLSKLYIAIGTDTEAVVPVNVLEGLFVTAAADLVRSSSGATIVNSSSVPVSVG